MKKFLIKYNLLFLIIVFFYSCHTKANQEILFESEEQKLVEQSINNVFSRGVTKDFGLFFSSIFPS